MAATVKDNDITVTYEDQMRINKFARTNSKMSDCKEELSSKQKEMDNLNDAEEEMIMIDGDNERIPYQIGEVLVEMQVEEAQAALEKAKENCQGEINALKERLKGYKDTLNDLKTQLYAKFGNSINLDQDDDS